MTAIDPQQARPIPPVTRHQAVYLDIDLAIGYTGDETAARDLLRLVEHSLTDDIGKIWQTLEAGDVAAAGRLVHAIKGFMPIFCRDPLVEQVTQAEALCETQSAESFRLVFADLAPALLQLLDDVRAYLSDLHTADGG